MVIFHSYVELPGGKSTHVFSGNRLEKRHIDSWFSWGLCIPLVHWEMCELVMGIPFSSNQNRDDPTVFAGIWTAARCSFANKVADFLVKAMYAYVSFAWLYCNMFHMFVPTAEAKRRFNAVIPISVWMNVDVAFATHDSWREITSQAMDRTTLQDVIHKGIQPRRKLQMSIPIQEMICLCFGPLRDG